jgi:hypothetical protein
MPVVNPVPYDKEKGMRLTKETVQLFKLSEKDLLETGNVMHHKFNFVEINKKLASQFNVMKHVQQTFKRTILDKSNSQNLGLIKK